MRPLRTRLQEARRRLSLPWEALERDYLLSWILAGISRTPVLRDTLVFKGGTALRKCYFGDYRFSEDLDFSTLKGIPTGNAMEGLIREVCGTAVRLLDEYAPVEITCERYTERGPPSRRSGSVRHPSRGFRGTAAYRPASWSRSPWTSVSLGSRRNVGSFTTMENH